MATSGYFSVPSSRDDPARQRNGQDVVEYFTEEADGDAAADHARSQRALSLLRAWSQLDDSEDVLDELDRIRHQSRPTPPIELPELDEAVFIFFSYYGRILVRGTRYGQRIEIHRHHP